MLRIALLFMLGIWMGDGLKDEVPAWTWLTGFGMTALTVVLIGRRPVVQSCLLFVATCLAGAWWASLREAHMAAKLPESPVVFRGVVMAPPAIHGKTLRCDLLLTEGPFVGRKVRTAILCDTVTNRWRQLRVGDGVEACSVWRTPRSWQHSGHFNYRRWMQVHGFVAETFVYYRDWRRVRLPLQRLSRLQRIRLRALSGRDQLLSYVRLQGLEGQGLATVAAMTLGDKSMLSHETREVYSVSGGSHVLALSGLHLSVLYAILSLLFYRRKRLLLTQLTIVLALWAYAVLTGLSPSVVRAVTMLTIYALTVVGGRGRNALNTLAVTAVAMLVANPLTLWDVGFQMSFMAVLSILLFYGPLYRLAAGTKLLRWRVIRWVWTMVCVSLAAQIGVSPLVMYYFGRFSTYFLLTNFVAVPGATLILYGAVVLALCAKVSWAASAVTTFLQFVAHGMNTILSVIASWPGASIEPIHVSCLQVLLMYVVVACLYGIAHYIRKMIQNARRGWETI